MRNPGLFPIITITIGITLLFYVTIPHGIGLSEDTISYLSAARSLHQSGEMRDIDGSWFVAWAPLYPLTIALLELLPFRVENSLIGLNLLLFSLTVISSWRLITKVLEKPFFRVTCLLAIVFSFTVMQVYATALSEAMFLLVVNLVVLVGARDGGRGTREFLLLGVLCALAASIRYIGIFLVPVVLFSFLGRKAEKFSIWKTLVFIAVAISPLAIWLARNWMLTDTLTGFRAPGETLFLRNVVVLAETATSWILPIKFPQAVRGIAFAGIIILTWKGWIQQKLRLHLLVVVVYLTLLLLAYLLFSFEEPRDRLLAPIFISFFILLFAGLENLPQRFPSIPKPAFILLICLWMTYPVGRVAKHIYYWHLEGVDTYNKKHWQHSQAIRWMKETTFPEIILSNDAHAIYYFTGKHATRIPKYIYKSTPLVIESEKTYVVWWKEKGLYNLQKIADGNLRLHKENEFDDVYIFSVRELKSTDKP